MIVGAGDHREPVGVLRDHERGVDGAVGPNRERGIPGIYIGTHRARERHGLAEGTAAIGRASKGDPLAAHPLFVHVAEPGVDRLLHLRVLTRAGRAEVVDGSDGVGGADGQRVRRAGERGDQTRETGDNPGDLRHM